MPAEYCIHRRKFCASQMRRAPLRSRRRPTSSRWSTRGSPRPCSAARRRRRKPWSGQGADRVRALFPQNPLAIPTSEWHACAFSKSCCAVSLAVQATQAGKPRVGFPTVKHILMHIFYANLEKRGPQNTDAVLFPIRAARRFYRKRGCRACPCTTWTRSASRPGRSRACWSSSRSARSEKSTARRQSRLQGTKASGIVRPRPRAAKLRRRKQS